MCYLKVALGSESGCTGMTLYEIDRRGWVHRQVQIHTEGVRFAPEDVLMCRPVNLEAMLNHGATEQINVQDFEVLWAELEPNRRFLAQIPDPEQSWSASYHHAGNTFLLRWEPSAWVSPEYSAVPGFTRLFVYGDPKTARQACAALFVENPIEWAPRTCAA